MSLELFLDNWPNYLVYFIAYVSALSAFGCNSIFWLRLLTIISSSCFVIYYATIGTEPLWLDITSESLLVLVNAVMLTLLWYRQKSIQFTEEEKELYATVFARFSAFEFYKLIHVGHWQTFEAGDVLTKQGKKVPALYFIYNGEVDIIVDNCKKLSLRDGYFIGELSFTLDQAANADVVVNQPTRILYWPQAELQQLLKRNPAMKNALEAMITQDLAKKLRQD
ncbi:cyclic nucleotide-binding domain-containing protein [Pseudoalteromonas tunicata]|uniref:Crp/Fnr family transcriptional regulator n=1 Tax=Pseudoalteromonas tunicata TaxID=314281 RepID=UPI00273E5AAD|nr:cyclic nucleotide-binding domain-containing protein [Pseudoalteromonas tunicata]MDP5214431.1 cyclic nucleotide-binding domain-containing protein [Pseudoalteromonas tunicata]